MDIVIDEEFEKWRYFIFSLDSFILLKNSYQLLLMLLEYNFL
jgi:hypothetical protein